MYPLDLSYDYSYEPDYAYRERFPEGTSDLDIELAILRNWERKHYTSPPAGNPWWHHFMCVMCMITPCHRIPWTERIVRAVEMVHRAPMDEYQILNLIGSQSSGKSAMMARISITFLAINAKNVAYGAAPYKNVASFTMWGEVRRCFQAFRKAAGNNTSDHWSEARYISSPDRCEFVNLRNAEDPRAGHFELVGLDGVAKFQGAKQVEGSAGFDSYMGGGAFETDEGGDAFIINADEVGVWKSYEFLEILANIASNEKLLVITGCNYKDTEGLEGALCKPRGREYSDLDIEGDHHWDSDFQGLTLRLDGHYAPNVLAALKAKAEGDPDWKNVAPYRGLLKYTRLKAAEENFGLTGPKYLEQIRSFPNQTSDEQRVLTRDKINANGGFEDDFVWDPQAGPSTLVAACDPGFGGDPCKFGVFRHGMARVQDISGTFHPRKVFCPTQSLATIKIDTTMLADAEFVSRLKSVMEASFPDDRDRGIFLEPGQKVTPEMQIAVRCGEMLAEAGVGRVNFGYDGSMREDLVTTMSSVLGPKIHAIRQGGDASDTRVPLGYNSEIGNKPITENKVYTNAVSAMYFNFAAAVNAGQVRGLLRIPGAVAQICRRKFYEQGKRKQVQPKTSRGTNKGFKEENSGQSPDDSDCTVNGFEMALRSGFVTEAQRSPGVVGASRVRRAVLEGRGGRKLRPRGAPRLKI